jgi:hypothetical protein
VEQVYTLCRNRWGYRVPSAQDDRRQLRLLCERALAFENYFLSTYGDFLLRELNDGCRENQARAVERLRQIHYPAPEFLDALHTLSSGVDEELRRSALNAIRVHETVAHC